MFSQQRHDLAHGLEMGPERLGLDFLLDGNQHINKIPNGSPGIHTPDFSSVPGHIKDDSEGTPQHRTHAREGENGRADHMDVLPPHAGEVAAHAAHAAHAVPVRNSPASCPLDSILLSFLNERRQQALDGVSTPTIVGPAYPSVSSLLNPTVNAHPLSKVFTDILTRFPALDALPERVAVLYIMFLVMRWQISPTQENYDRLPDWVTPRPSQLFTPHPAWIDHLPWPQMRDKLVRCWNSDDYQFENFFLPFTTTLSLNWPYEPTDTLLSSGEGPDGELMINPVFERHLRRLDNWSLGPAFAKQFPGLVDTFRLKNDGDKR
jgi:hypothetical protein